MRGPLVAVFALLLPACATVPSGGFEIPASYADREFPKLKARATFDLDCPGEQLTVTTLNVFATPGGDYPSEVGVKGCGRKAVYHPRSEAWFINGGPSRVVEAEAPVSAAAPKPAP